MARMTVEQAAMAIKTAVTFEAIKAILMSCDKWTMARAYEEITLSGWKGDVNHTRKEKLAEQIASTLSESKEIRDFEAMTVAEKCNALTTRGKEYAERVIMYCTEREYDEIGLMLGVKFTRQHSPLARWNMLIDAIEKLQAEENVPAVVEVAPTADEISKTAEKYLADEMTANEVEAVMSKAESETLREFATQKGIPIADNEDRAGLVKILMEELVCEKLGVYDDEPDQLAPVIEAVKAATTIEAIVNALMACTSMDMLKICTELTGVERTRIACGMLPKRHTAEKVAKVLMAHRA